MKNVTDWYKDFEIGKELHANERFAHSTLSLYEAEGRVSSGVSQKLVLGMILAVRCASKRSSNAAFRVKLEGVSRPGARSPAEGIEML